MSSRKASWQDRDPQHAAEGRRYAEPIPSRAFILEEFADAAAPLNAAALAQRLGLRKAALRTALEKRLEAMVRDGQLERVQGERFGIPRDYGELTGRVSGHRDGYGWFEPEDGSQDVHIDSRQMANVMHGDRVRIRVTADDTRGRRSGAVLEVLERGTEEIAGTLEDAGDAAFVVPEDPRQRHRVLIPRANRAEARHGDMVIARIVEPPAPGTSPLGEIVRVLDRRNAADLAVEMAIATHNLPREFPPEALREAAQWGASVRPQDIAGREDLRDLALVTIDGEDARDFDDAVFCEARRGGGWRLLVAIADVSHYVTTGGALDEEAQERGTSIYFPDRVIPMLPEALSNELCSLKPQVDRLALTCEMRVDTHGEVSHGRFFPAVIRSAARLTYNQVAAILLAKDSALRARHGALVPHLEQLHALYQALRAARERRGALDFDSPEVKIRLTPEGSVAGLDVHARNDAHRLIEECMIAANIEAARCLRKRKLATLYRVHGEPEERRVTELQRMLRALGVGVRFPERIGTRELRQVLKLIAGRPDAAFIESLVIRSLPQAVYQPTNIGHFGLGLEEYAHFTSPIRRYPDLLVHRAIRHAVSHGSRSEYAYAAKDMERLGISCSALERRADEAAREVLAYLKCDYMREHLGDEFEAVITAVVEFGFFVQLANLQVDGLVHVSSLGGDYYAFEAARCAWTGTRTRKSYQLGNRVLVRLKRVDMRERQMDFEVATEAQATSRGRSGGRARTPRRRSR